MEKIEKIEKKRKKKVKMNWNEIRKGEDLRIEEI